MCGIIGYVGFNNAYNTLTSSLKLLEYRGYDSVGVALFNSGKVKVYKLAGRTSDLENKLKDKNLSGRCGIGHTRWATHGVVADRNAHPFKVGKVTLVHNGIIENYKEIINEYHLDDLKSQTDSEVVCSLLNKLYNGKPLETIVKVKKILRGTYALLLMFDGFDNCIYGTRHISPLVYGFNKQETLIASETLPLNGKFNKYFVLEENQILEIGDKATLYDDDLNVVKAKSRVLKEDIDLDLSNYDSYLDKEIHEQPSVLMGCLNHYVKDDLPFFNLNKKELKKINKIEMIACGTSYHACLFAKEVFEKYANIACNVSVASEFNFHKHFIDENTLLISLSQSGETIDTIEASKYGKKLGGKLLALVNVENSELVHISDYHILSLAGREMSVASSKAYTSQLLILELFAYYLALIRNNMTKIEVREKINDLCLLPSIVRKILADEESIKKLVGSIYKKKLFLLGRGCDYISLLEAALKIKELAYLNVNTYMAGEIKHGPIALIDSDSVVFGLSLSDELNIKLINNLKECASRNSKVILITSKNLDRKQIKDTYILPSGNKDNLELACIVYFQLLAKNLAIALNRDVDKPRNLAKVVTVE